MKGAGSTLGGTSLYSLVLRDGWLYQFVMLQSSARIQQQLLFKPAANALDMCLHFMHTIS